MHKRLFLASLLTTILLAGCFPSIGPFYKEDQPFFEPGLLGKWVPSEDDDDTLEVERLAGTNAYRITGYDDEEARYVLLGNLFKVGDVTFLDVTIDAQTLEAECAKHPACARLMFRELTLPIHQLYRVERTEAEVKLFLGDTDWLEKHLADHPGRLRHLQRKGILTFSDLLLTDTPGGLQAFFSKHSQEAFNSDPSVYTRVRQPQD